MSVYDVHKICALHASVVHELYSILSRVGTTIVLPAAVFVNFKNGMTHTMQPIKI